MPGATVSSTPAASPTGFFGKLPSRGDFIARHLPRAFLDPWDTWLQKAIACSRQQLGGAWRECYCTSPIWRFALGAGVCGPRAYAGVLMPSVDRVGRYYPLVIAAPLAPDRPLLTLPTSATDWFERAESLALLGLERDDLALDAFEQQVAALGNSETPADKVGLGTKVKVLDLETNEPEEYMLVLAEMMDLDAGHISLASPLGRALKGRSVGDEIELRLPRGQRALRVLGIEQTQ